MHCTAPSGPLRHHFDIGTVRHIRRQLNRLALGMGTRAEAKADALAQIPLTPNPMTALSTIDDIVAREAAYMRFVAATGPNG